MRCTVCNHPQRHDIDCALLAGNATYAALSQQYGLSISALFRHKKLLNLKMARVEKDLLNNLRQGTLFQFNDFLEQTKHLARTAGADGNIRQALQAVRAGTRILNFITKLDVQLDQDTVYRVLASPQWLEQDSLLPTDPRIITDTHQALADNLFYPCPELPAALEDEVHREEISATALETKNQPPATVSAAETPPKIQRETSAKLPRKSPCYDNFNEQYQIDKVSPKNSHVGRESEAPPAVKQSYVQSVDSYPRATDRRQAIFAPAVPPELETLPKSQREKGAKLPRQTPSSDHINEPYQANMPGEKIPAPNSLRHNWFFGQRPTANGPRALKTTSNQTLGTLITTFKTFIPRWPGLLATGNRNPKTANRL